MWVWGTPEQVVRIRAFVVSCGHHLLCLSTQEARTAQVPGHFKSRLVQPTQMVAILELAHREFLYK